MSDTDSVGSDRSRFVAVGIVAVVLGSLASGGVVLSRQIEAAREAAARASCNLGQISLALHNYHEEYGTFPPAVVRGANGEPLHSWRVLILAYVEEAELYREFRLDEPWDSPHNRRLIDRMPSSYEPSWTRYVEVPPNHTVCRVLVGPGTAFEGDGVRLDDVPDGASRTLLFVEAGEPVPWTKPDAIAYDPDRPVNLKGLFRDGFRACTVAGDYEFVRYDTGRRTLHRLVTRNGDEQWPSGW